MLSIDIMDSRTKDKAVRSNQNQIFHNQDSQAYINNVTYALTSFLERYAWQHILGGNSSGHEHQTDKKGTEELDIGSKHYYQRH
jgi:hypothetical protein